MAATAFAERGRAPGESPAAYHRLPPRLREEVDGFPAAEWHGASLPLANRLCNSGFTLEEADALFAYVSARDGGRRDRRKLNRNDYAKPWLERNGRPATAPFPGRRASRWPAVDRRRLDALDAARPPRGESFLRSLSPEDPERLTPAEFVRRMYAPGEWVCMGLTQYNFGTLEARRWLSAPESWARCGLVVPNPMRAQWGTTADGRPSMHAKANSASCWRYLVYEGDAYPTGEAIPLDTQARAILDIAEGLPLIAVTRSGGKSLHAYFAAAGYAPDVLRAWQRRMRALGADHHLFATSHFARLPGGLRGGKVRQSPVYWAPHRIPPFGGSGESSAAEAGIG